MGKNEVVARNGTESLQLIKSPECRKRTLRTGDDLYFSGMRWSKEYKLRKTVQAGIGYKTRA